MTGWKKLVRSVPVWGWILLGMLTMAGAFWVDARLGLLTLEALPLIGGGMALYKVIRMSAIPPEAPTSGVHETAPAAQGSGEPSADDSRRSEPR